MTRKAYGMKKDAAQERRISLPLLLAAGALALIIIGLFVLLRGSDPTKAIEVAGKPRLVVDGDKVDLGKVPLNKPVTVEFVLSNVGDSPLQLEGIPKVEVKQGC